MGLRIIDKKFASAVAIAGAVSLVSVPAWAAGDREPGAAQQPGAAQYQTEKQRGQEMHQQLSSEQIREAQEKLRDEGHNPGPIDGIWGSQTQAAVREFQREKDIQVTGQLDKETLDELGVDANDRGAGLMDRQRGEVRRDAPGAPEAQQRELGQQDRGIGQPSAAQAQQRQDQTAGYGMQQQEQYRDQQQLGQQDRERVQKEPAGERPGLPPHGTQPGNATQQQDQAAGMQQQEQFRDQQQLDQQEPQAGERRDLPPHGTQPGTAGQQPQDRAAGMQQQEQFRDQQQLGQQERAPGTAMPKQERAPGQQQFGAQHQQLSSEQVRQVQQKLQQEGHNPGPIDGIWGPQTQAAVRDFQQKNNLQVSGQLDQRTMKELGVTAEPSAARERQPHIGEDLPPVPEAAKPGNATEQPGQQQVR